MASRKPEAETLEVTTQQQPPPTTSAVSTLPPEHVDHAAVYYNEHAIRKQGFEAGLSAIDAEIEGKKIEREEKIAAIERDYKSDMASLERRRTMMVVGTEMAGAALERYEALNPPSPERQQHAEKEDEQSDHDNGNT